MPTSSVDAPVRRSNLDSKRRSELPLVITPLLRSRKWSIFLACIVILQFVLTYFDLPGWQCPILHATSIPCPGCGLSRAVVALLRGDWQTSLTLHAFAPLLLLGVIILLAVPFLPGRQWHRAIRTIEAIERRTGLAFLGLVALFLYWAVRLIAFPSQTLDLIGR